MSDALIDLTQPFYHGMPGFSFTRPDGTRVDCTAHIREALSHAETAAIYDGQCAFAYTETTFFTSIGTRLDAPYIRWPEKRDIAKLALDDVVLPGWVVDARGIAPETALTPEAAALPEDLAGHAVLFNYGWDAHWGGALYLKQPYLSDALIDLLIARGVKLVGVDAVSVDGKRDPTRPAHSRLLAEDILIVEDLRHLDRLHGQQFRFFAAPIPARGAASMPVRAFAEITGPSGQTESKA